MDEREVGPGRIYLIDRSVIGAASDVGGPIESTVAGLHQRAIGCGAIAARERMQRGEHLRTEIEREYRPLSIDTATGGRAIQPPVGTLHQRRVWRIAVRTREGDESRVYLRQR